MFKTTNYPTKTVLCYTVVLNKRIHELRSLIILRLKLYNIYLLKQIALK